MATLAHCAYCFETLVAHFERRHPLRLAEVEESWDQYQKHELADDVNVVDGEVREDEAAKSSAVSSRRPAAIARVLDATTNASNSTLNSSSARSSPSTTSSTPVHSSRTNTPASSVASSKTSLQSSSSNQAYPLFVTWNTVSRSGRKSLRGCIGTFEAQELEDGLQSYSLTSALEDVRFSPIPASLVPSLSAHVTLLTNFSTPQRDPLGWELGKHGIRISFTQHGRRYGSTYLPDVAREQGWTKEEALISLMQKAGWNGSSDDWRRVWDNGRGELITYEGRQVGLSFAEWKAWRDWADENSHR